MERVIAVGAVGCVLGVVLATPAGAVNEQDGAPCDFAGELEGGPITLWWAPNDPGIWNPSVLAEVEYRVGHWNVPRRLAGAPYLEFKRWQAPGLPAGAPSEPDFEIFPTGGPFTGCWDQIMFVPATWVDTADDSSRTAGALAHEFGHVALQSLGGGRINHTPRGAAVPGQAPPALSTCADLAQNDVGFDDEVQLARRWDHFDPLTLGNRPAAANGGFETALVHWKRSAGLLSARNDGTAYNGSWYARWAASTGATMSPVWTTTWGGEEFVYSRKRTSAPVAHLRLTSGSAPVDVDLVARARGIQWAAGGCDDAPSQWPDGRNWNLRLATTAWVEQRTPATIDDSSQWNTYGFNTAEQPYAQRCGLGTYSSCVWQGMDTWLTFEWESGSGSIDIDDVYDIGGVVESA